MVQYGESPKLIVVDKIFAKSGHLSFIEEMDHFPIDVKRVYWIYDTDEGSQRGDHAHLNSYRLVVCMKGIVEAEIENVEGTIVKYVLDAPYKILYFPKLHWVKFKFSDNAILMALCSSLFKDDIICTDYSQFRNLAKKQIEINE